MSGTRRVLIVEDDDGVRESIEECLAAEGYAVAPATNGVEALDRLRRGPRPDLIVLDLVMPVMNGTQFLETLRGEDAIRDIPVVLMTAATPVVHSPLPVADGYLPKPFELTELLATVGRFAGGRAA